jgi:hypothetical protein
VKLNTSTLIVPEELLFDQWFSETRLAQARPEQALWYAVLLDGLNEVRLDLAYDRLRGKTHPTLLWMGHPDAETIPVERRPRPFRLSYEDICDVLDVNASALRTLTAQAWRERHLELMTAIVKAADRGWWRHRP